MKTFLVIYRPGEAWIVGRPVSEQPLAAHGRYLLRLYQAGTLRFAGPFEDDAGGATVIEAPGEAEAHTIASHDPAVVDRIFVYELHPWRLVDWERHTRAA
ncbi:MAG TPA: YciI family protein [Herpetosiphonaceae bacterium]